MPSYRAIEVVCSCGAPLARYQKGGTGRLVKMFFHKILTDRAGVFVTDPPRKLDEEILCPQCSRRVATVRVVRGQYAAKVNQGAVRVK